MDTVVCSVVSAAVARPRMPKKIPLLNGKGGPPFLFTYNSKVVAAQLTKTKFKKNALHSRN